MVWHSAHYAHSVRRRNGCIQCILTKQRKMATKWNFVSSSHVVNLKIVPKCHQSSTYKIEREKQFPCLIPYSRHIVGKLKSVIEKGIFLTPPTQGHSKSSRPQGDCFSSPRDEWEPSTRKMNDCIFAFESVDQNTNLSVLPGFLNLWSCKFLSYG